MSTGNNLQNSLKRAFDDYEVPLKDAQWKRLEGEIGGGRKKWKFFPYYFSGVLLIAIVSGIMSYYFIFEKNEFSNNKNLSKYKKYKFDSELNNYSKNLSKQQNEGNANLSETLKSSDNLKNNSITKSNNNNSIIRKNIQLNNQNNELKTDEVEISFNEININTNKSNDNIDVKDTSNKSEDIAISDKDNEKEIKAEEKNDELENKNHDSATSKPTEDLKPKPKSKYVLSLSTGYSSMNVKVTTVEDISKVHKDTRKLFEMSNKNTRTLFINFGFESNVFKGFNIGINTGFQYLHITQPVNINYRILEIPFYDINRNIIGYIPKDSANAQVLSTTSTNKTSFLKIPLRFSYTLPLNSKNEMLITAGTNISTIISAKGNVIALNEGQVKPLSKKMYGKINFGFLGGLQYCRQVKNNWWMGLENQWQINNEKYKNGPEIIKSRLSGYNINLILKYKI